MVTYRRKRTYRKKSRLAKLLKPKSSAITVLAKQVRSIQRVMKRQRIFQNYFQTTVAELGDTLSHPVTIIQLNRFSAWQRIFGTGANDEEGNKMIWKSFGLDMHFRSYNETDQINFTVFIVSLKDKAGYNFDPTTGVLTLTAGPDYVNSSNGPSSDVSAGLVMINKNKFNIHMIRRFTLGNYGAPLNQSGAQTQYGTDRRIYFKHRPNRTIQNPNGDWKLMNADPDPSNNYYMLVFNNNATADGESPRVFYSFVHTVEQLS